jgi:YHS domain-containing protein
MPRSTRPASRALARPARALALACAACLAPVSPAKAQAIPWRTDLDRALAEAKAQDRPVWIQFTGPWCGYCRQMEREAFADPAVVRIARERGIPVQVRSDLREDLATRYGITAIPATVIVRPDGGEIGRSEGFTEAPAFRAFLGSTLARYRPAAAAGGLGLGGHCPVTLVREGRLAPGRAGIALIHGGREYRFAGAAQRDRFREDPEPFLPADSGRCAVSRQDRGQAVAGNPRFAVLYRGRLYLCEGEPARARFATDPERYANPDVAERGFCPHCKADSGRLVRGEARYSTTHDGRRYFFPDPEHLAAYRAAPESFLR